MKKHLLFLVALTTLNTFGQNFPLNSVNWPLPDGGKKSNGTFYGFNAYGGSALSFDNTGSQTWSLLDINGDRKLDLVVTAQLQGNQITCFSPGIDQYWKVYLNNGNGFSTQPINWSLPNGGRIQGGQIYGFDYLSGSASSFDNTGSQSWTLTDVNGDIKPDLVITGQLQGGQVTCFSPGAGQYWKVFLNNGNGFNPTYINWNLPQGGKLFNGVTFGYNEIANIASTSDNTGSQSWSVSDINGDKIVDLIVTAQLQGGQVSCFSPGAGQYWKVYLGTASPTSTTTGGFSSTSINWNLPNGGRLSNGNTFGYDFLNGSAFSSDNTGSQTWTFMDLDHDDKPELIVTAQLQGGVVSCFSPGANQYWKVYSNTGNGYSLTPTTWNLPNGGKLSNGNTFGYDNIYGSAASNDNTGSQSWSLEDMNGDYKPDLVVTGQLQAGVVSCFSPGSNQYWKVFSSNGSGFNTIPVNANLPNGGKLSGGTTYGYNSIYGTAASNDNTGSQSWILADLNGDALLDLVVTAQLQSNNVTTFSPASSQYWKVFYSALIVGIKQGITTSKNLTAYPNPNNGNFVLESDEREIITVSNEIGQVVRTIELNEGNNFSTEIQNLQSGLYIVTGQSTKLKMVVLK